ncbi:MAG TPA: T9SS type A sorting domain-containing protein [Candidatus Marinimicrobia bacterium]|nr:T9SS type A sorting domain-containing protein [Candidatus Neomarinimicrobiota bacterium]
MGPPPNGIEPPIWFFSGIIDEPAVWNRALTQDEITTVFTSGVELESDGLVGFWPFDEGNGQIVFDHSNLGNHGFLGEVSNEDSADPLWTYTQLSNEDEILPVFENVVLHPNFPNPFNPVTTLRYDLPEDSQVSIMIYDIMGRKVKTLVNKSQNAGFKATIWDATNDLGQPVSAGIYLYTIQAGDFRQTRKMVLLK